jgi:predicted transcriptional regulator with HTH domain
MLKNVVRYLTFINHVHIFFHGSTALVDLGLLICFNNKSAYYTVINQELKKILL